MVPPVSHRISRVPRYLGTQSREPHSFRLQGYHPLWRVFPDASARNTVFDSPTAMRGSPTESRNPGCTTRACLTYTPVWAVSRSLAATREIEFFFLFLGLLRWFSSPRWHWPAYFIQPAVAGHDPNWGPPFGNPRIKGCLRLPEAYRSLPRPSSPTGTKSSTLSP